MKGIYKITNLINKKVYIGQSERLIEREWEHFYRLGRGEHNNEHLLRG
jgi:predicted GIY-YIG superfamily endonuclease